MSQDEKTRKIERCKFCHPTMRTKELQWHCHIDGWEDDKIKTVTAEICENCEKFKSQYIEYPLTIQGIEVKFSEDIKYSLHKSGQLVKIAPCGKEYEGKTYLGILLGDLPISATVSFHHDDQKLYVGAMTNPAIFVPELKKIIYGCESWWGEIEKPEDLKDITPEVIDNVWYVKLLKEMTEKEKADDGRSSD